MTVCDIEHRKVRVLIVDDTRTVRHLIRAVLSRVPRIEIVGEAVDPYEARRMIRELDPDVITLDVEMPRMDGLSFLERIMRLRPMPVVMVSSRTSTGSRAAVRALSLGAVDCVDITQIRPGQERTIDLAQVILTAASSRPRRPFAGSKPHLASDAGHFDWNGRIIVIGSSTGGVDALLTVLSDFPADGPPTVICQHMPAEFLKSFTARLDRHVHPSVTPVEDGAKMRQGMVCVGPGGTCHVALSKADPLVLRSVPDTGRAAHVPSVDVLFGSAERHGQSVIGVMLTGMGRDGADAMARMRCAGSHTIVQSGGSAVVDGMPKAARELGAASEVVALRDIGKRILISASHARKDKS